MTVLVISEARKAADLSLGLRRHRRRTWNHFSSNWTYRRWPWSWAISRQNGSAFRSAAFSLEPKMLSELYTILELMQRLDDRLIERLARAAAVARLGVRLVADCSDAITSW